MEPGFHALGSVRWPHTSSFIASFYVNVSGKKIKLCHRTGSTNNPYVTTGLSRNAVAVHLRGGDVLGKYAPGCPGTTIVVKLLPISIEILPKTGFHVYKHHKNN